MEPLGNLGDYFTELGWPSEQLHKVYSRLFHSTNRESYGFAFGAASVMHRASRQKIRVWNFWPFILALCEAAEPSIIVEFILVTVIGKLLKIDFVSEDCSNTTEPLDKLVSFTRLVRNKL